MDNSLLAVGILTINIFYCSRTEKGFVIMKILYVMHIDWDWIKQRPQYIAEYLGKSNMVYVLYDKNYKSNKLTNNDSELKFLEPFYRIRGEYRCKLVHWINSKKRESKICKICRDQKIDMIYITSPSLVDSIPKNFTGEIIYDCMDDHIAMVTDSVKDKMLSWENSLIAKSSKVIFSSEHLCKVVLKRGNCHNIKYKVIRNGYAEFKSTEIMTRNPIKINKDMFNICYFGTISNWFDWEIIQLLIKKYSNICFHIFGPVNSQISEVLDDRIIMYGSVNHELLYSYTENMDCFIMPFKINDVIMSVDPVKLYEYIYLNKNIIVPFYPEIKRFEPFVFFYNNFSDIENALSVLMKIDAVKYSNELRIDFLKMNSWEYRAHEVDVFLRER